MDLGNLIKKYRDDNNLSLRDFAKRTGCSYEYVRQIEGGKFIPTNINKLIPILNELGITVESYIAGDRPDNDIQHV